MPSYEKCYERPYPESEKRCSRPVGHKGEHVDSKVGRYAWGGKPKPQGPEIITEFVRPKERLT